MAPRFRQAAHFRSLVLALGGAAGAGEARHHGYGRAMKTALLFAMPASPPFAIAAPDCQVRRHFRSGGHSSFSKSPRQATIGCRPSARAYFVFTNPSVALDESMRIEIRMNHLKELAESVDVHFSPPVIDPGQTSDTKRLNNQQILNVPFPLRRITAARSR